MKHIVLFAVALFGLLIVSSPSFAKGFYATPRAGIFLPVDGGDEAYAVGVTGGYGWNMYFATEITYEHIFGTDAAPDGDLVEGVGIGRYPMEWITPHLSAGIGYLHTDYEILADSNDTFFLFGAGASLKPLGPIALGLGVNYRAVINNPDYVEPYVSVGIVF